MGNLIPVERIPADKISNSTASGCDQEKSNQHLAEVVVLCSAAAVIVVFNLVNMIVKRSPLHIVIPVDLLNSTPFRIVYCTIMTLWAADVFQDLFSHDMHYHAPDNAVLDAAKFFALSPTVIFLRQALIYFPVLASVDFSVPCLGHYTGFLYTLLMGAYNVYKESVVIRGCSHRGQLDNLHIIISVAVKSPVFIGYVLVAGWFFCHAVVETTLILFAKMGLTSKIKDYNLADNFEDHVKKLLKKPIQGNVFNIKRNVPGFAFLGFQYVLPYLPTFEYPLPFMAAMSMGWMVMYQLCLQLMTHQVKFAYNFIDFVDSFNITVAALSDVFPAQKLRFESVFYDIRSFAEALLIIPPLGTAIAFGLAGFFTMYLVQNFHKRLMRAARGDIGFLVASEPLPSKTYILAASMKYCSFQMSYLIFGWMIYVFMEVSLLTVGLGFYYMFKNVPFEGVRIFAIFMVPMMWSAALHHLQLIVCRMFFLKKEPGDFICIRLRGLYQLLTYILFFFNMMFGVIMGFLRVFTSFMFTIVMFFRIDWDVYMRGAEGWDFGHRTYVGYMYLEYTYNNAVLRAFVQLLTDSARQRQSLRLHSLPVSSVQNRSDRSRSTSPEPSERTGLLTNGQPTVLKSRRVGGPVKAGNLSSNSRRARNRWLVAYTLLRNHELISLTATNLRANGCYYVSDKVSFEEDSKSF